MNEGHLQVMVELIFFIIQQNKQVLIFKPNYRYLYIYLLTLKTDVVTIITTYVSLLRDKQKCLCMHISFL